MITKEKLLRRYNLTEEEFEAANIAWEDLKFIYKDFSNKKIFYEEKLQEFEKQYLNNISQKGIHSYRTRIKDPEHLVVKIIRKRQENNRKYKNLDKDNYEKFITDLIGIRCFILFKSDWEIFHNYIVDKIENDPKRYVKDSLKDFDDNKTNIYIAEMPKVHIRSGDSREIYEKVLPPDAIKSKKVYRSVHYIVKYKSIYIEIQVRTLFEEGWGEIDHYIVYPRYQNDLLFQQYTGLLNRLTGLADEMSSFFCEVKRLEMEHLEKNPKVFSIEKKVENKESLKKDVSNKKKKSFFGNTPEDCLNNVLNE